MKTIVKYALSWFVIFTIFWLAQPCRGYAQQSDRLTAIALGQMKGDKIHEVVGSAFRLTYHLQADQPSILFSITGAGKEKLYETQLDGKSGHHEEVIELAGPLSNSQPHTVYFVNWKSGATTQRARIKFNAIPNTPLPSASVAYKPIQVDCDPFVTSVVEFTGSASGGTPPYQGTWYVSDGPSIKDLKFAPKPFTLSTSFDESYISVERSLDYYLTLLIEDNCKKISKSVYKVKCDERGGEVIIELQPIGPDEIGGDYK